MWHITEEDSNDAMDADRVGADASHRCRSIPPPIVATTLVRAVRDRPDDGRAWGALTDWLRAHGHADEAEAVGAFWPAIADGLQTGMPLIQAMGLLGRHAAGFAKLARRLCPAPEVVRAMPIADPT